MGVMSEMGPTALEAYFGTVRDLPVLAPEEARSLAWKSWSGDRAARQALIERHLWLVVDLAVRLAPGGGGRLTALLASGNQVLIEASERYRPWADGEIAEYLRDALFAGARKEALLTA